MTALSVEVIDGVAVITFDMPGEPVNKLNRGMKDEFTALFDRIERDSSVRAAVLMSGKPDVWIAGADIDERDVFFKRRIGRWLLWRAGPATKGNARYVAVASDDLAASYAFRLFADGRGEGAGPSGVLHERFRAWKEDLRDHH